MEVIIMFSLLNVINNVKALTTKKDNKSAEDSVDFFNGEVQMFDKYGYSRCGSFDGNIYSYYFKKVYYDQDETVIDVNYKDIL